MSSRGNAESLPGISPAKAQWEAAQVWVQVPTARPFLTAGAM